MFNILIYITMAITYKTCQADGTIPAYVCDPCSEGENGRVSGVFFIKKSALVDATAANLVLLSWWETKIAAGDIIVIPSVRGTYDGGAKNTITGFGRQSERVTGKTHTVVFNDNNHAGNQPFYESLENNAKNYAMGFVTENELRLGAKALDTFEAKDPVEEDVKSKVVWNATATWIQSAPKTLPIIDISDSVDIINLFDNCINSTNPA
jgi:hypothetical protein